MRKIDYLWIVLITVNVHTFVDGTVIFNAYDRDELAVGDKFRLS